MVLPNNPRWRWGLGSFLAIATIALAACNSGTGLTTSTGNGGSTTQQATTILQHAQNAGLHDATFTITITGTGGIMTGTTTSDSNTPFTANGKGQLTTTPKQVQIAFDNLSVAGFSTSAQVISTDQALYLKVPQLSKWIQADATQVSGLNNVNDALNYTLLQNVQLVGSETVNGVAAYHLRSTGQPATTANQAASGAAARTTDLWLRQDNYFPLKIVTHVAAQGAGDVSAANGTPQVGSGTPVAGTTALDQTITFSAWNTGVTITAPSPSDIQNIPTP